MSSLPVPSRMALQPDGNPLGDGRDAGSPALDLRVGALVVYGEHGVGRVSRRTAAKSGTGGTVVVEFAADLSVTLPLERAALCLRSLANEVDLARVEDALRSQDAVVEKSWQVRTKTTRTKIASGEAVGLAEVVRDAVGRERQLAAGSGLSSYERELYLKARRLLAAELGVATGTDEIQAEAWIEGQLAVTAAGPE
jgi:RNA polymerase-interacting CarD/CdnL/TRCF family regulator